MKVVYIQYAGDFSEAYQRIVVNKGGENYYGQKYTVETVVEQARRGWQLLVITLDSEGYRTLLETNLKAVGFRKGDDVVHRVKRELAAFRPDRAILAVPDRKILAFLNNKRIPTLPMLADSFDMKPTLRQRIYRWRLARSLCHENIKWAGNHQINAAKSLMKLGLPSDKILPYDWEHADNPENWPDKSVTDIGSKQLRLFYAGSFMKEKGVLDLVASLRILVDMGRDVVMDLAGRGDTLFIEKAASILGVYDRIKLLGLLPHRKILENMHTADLVVVPSHHAYPEGLPMTIMESLMVGTPVIASDHPMFVNRVGLRGAVQFFEAENPNSLAMSIFDVCKDKDHYQEAQSQTAQEWNDLTLKSKWSALINAWLCDPEGVDLSEHCLAKSLQKEKTSLAANKLVPTMLRTA